MYFANPLFLIGLAAIAIPIAVHLFSFRRYRKVYFSNVDRIEELRDESRRQSQLRQWLLLAARIMAVACLVMVFAQPMLPTDDQTATHDGSTAVSVYIDNSFSMQATDSEGTLLDLARQKAREIAAAYHPNDRFQLMTNDMDGTQFRWLARDEFLLALDDIEVSPLTVPLSQATRRLHGFMRQGSASNRHAYLISDLQLSTADMADLPIDNLIATTIVPLEATDRDNIYIDSVAPDAPAYHKGAAITLKATLRNAGNEDVEKVPVRLFVNGRQRALASIDLPARGSATAMLNYVADQDGVADCYIETTDQPLTFDDRLYFSLNIASRLQVLVIGSENPFLARLFDGDSAIGYRHARENAIDFSRLRDHNFIVVNELDKIESGLSQALQRFVADGGSLLVIPSNRIDETSYAALLTPMNAPTPAEWHTNHGKALAINQEASLYKGVFEGTTDQLEMPEVKACYRLETTAATHVEPLITLTDGAPLLSATQHETGRLYLMGCPLQTDYTDFMQQALFVPTLYNMALYSRPQPNAYYTLGHEGPIPVAAAPHAAARLSLVDGDYTAIPDIRIAAGRPAMWLRGQLSRPGNYHLVIDDGQPEGFSFNYARQESDMRFLKPDEAADHIKQWHKEGYSTVPNSQRSLEQYVRQRSQGKPLWRWFLMAALLMLAAETLILRWPARGKKKPVNTAQKTS